jgi:hypothetical protein
VSSFRHSVVASAFSASLVLAQDDLSPRQFIPSQIDGYYVVDLEAMRDSGAWDGLFSGVGAVLLQQVERLFGLSLREIHRIEAYDSSAESSARPPVNHVQILHGSPELDVPNGRDGAYPVRIAGHEVLFEAPSEWALPGDQGWMWCRLGEGVMVAGARGLIEPVLKGVAKPDVIPPDLLSLSAGRGVIAHCTGFIRAGDSVTVSSMIPFDDPLLEGVPAPRCASLRLRLDESKLEDEWDDPSIVIEATVRWERQGDSAAQVVTSVQKKIAEWREHPRIGALRAIFDKVALSSDGIDAKLSLDLGRPRQAATLMSMAMPFLMFTAVSTEPVMAQEVELEAVEVESPLPPPPPAEPSPNGGGR